MRYEKLLNSRREEKKLNKKILAILLLIETVVVLYAGSAIYAHFSDVVVSSGNVFSAGAWTPCGELIDFIVPENVIQGQTALFSVIFRNCGDIPIYATANVQIRRGETGENMTLIQTSQTPVEASQTVTFELLWNTTGYNSGNYRAIAWVEYNSHATEPTDPTKFHVTNEKTADINILDYTS